MSQRVPFARVGDISVVILIGSRTRGNLGFAVHRCVAEATILNAWTPTRELCQFLAVGTLRLAVTWLYIWVAGQVKIT